LSKKPDHTEGLLLKAALLVKNNKNDEALEIGKGIIKRDVGNLDAIIFLASIYIKDNKYNEAVSVLDEALKLKPGNDQLNNLLALVLVKNKEYDRAILIYKKFLEKYPDSKLSYERLASLYKAIDEKDKSEAMLRASIANNPEDTDRYLIFVKYIHQEKGEEKAIEELEKFSNANKNIAKLRMALAELYYSKGDKQSAVNVYNGIINDFPEEISGVEASILLASYYLNIRDYDKSREIVEKMITISPNDPKLNVIRARLAIHANELEKAIISLRIVIKETPNNIDAYFMLVNIYTLENNKEQVLNTLNIAYENNRMYPPALLKLAKFYINRDFEKAEKIIDSYNELKEFDYEGMSIKTAILNSNKKGSEAYALASKLVELYTDKPNGYLQSIPYLLERDRIKDAISILEKGYENTKDSRKILVLLTKLQVSEKQFDTAEKRIKDELKLSPEDIELKIILSKVYMANGTNRRAEKLLTSVVKVRPDIEEPYLLLSFVYKNTNKKALQKSILAKGKANVITSYKIPLKLAALYEKDFEYQKAIDVYRDMYNLNSSNLVVVNNLASLLSDYSDNKDDHKLMKILADKLEEKGGPIFLDTIGWVAYKTGDYQNAIKYLNEVVNDAPDVNIFNYHLGMAYKKAGDKSQAKVYLEKSLINSDDFKEKDRAKAALNNI